MEELFARLTNGLPEAERPEPCWPSGLQTGPTQGVPFCSPACHAWDRGYCRISKAYAAGACIPAVAILLASVPTNS